MSGLQDPSTPPSPPLGDEPTVAVDPSNKRSLPVPWVFTRVAVLLGLIVIVVVVGLVARNAADAYSPDYAGAPVDAADAVAGEVVVAYNDSVAYSLGPTWVDANDFVDLSAVADTLPQQGEVLGEYFTDDPAAAVPQFIAVFAAPPAFAGQPLDLIFEKSDAEAAQGLVPWQAGETTHFTTANGLDGLTQSVRATISGIVIEAQISALANGYNIVLVQWVSFDGPVDEEAYQAFLDSIRIDG